MQPDIRSAPTRGPAALRSAPRLLLLALAAVLLLTVVWWTGPRPVSLSGERHGDPALAEAVAPHLRDEQTVAVVFWEGGAAGRPRFAGFGADEHRSFELASVSKTFTAALLMEMTARGELSPDTTVAEILGERAVGSAIAEVTLRELASHTSGLPRSEPGFPWFGLLLRKDSGWPGPEVIIAQALEAELQGRGEFRYSNLGVSLLGQLLAERGGASYEQLVRERLLEPLEMSETSIPTQLSEVPADAERGRTASGQPVSHTALGGATPAGGVRSTARDVATWIRAMQSGANPGSTGLEPIAPLTGQPDGGAGSIATGWFLEPAADGGTIVLHGGDLAGGAAFVGYHRENGRGVVLLSASGTGSLHLQQLAVELLSGRIAVEEARA